MDYYLLHELAHNPRNESSMKRLSPELADLDGRGELRHASYAASAQFGNIEAAANTIARGIAQSLGGGVVVPANPTHGCLPPS